MNEPGRARLSTRSILLAVALIAPGLRLREQEPPPVAPVPPRGHEAFELAELRRQAHEARRVWSPFLERSTLEVGLYRLASGSDDHQSPHEWDEVYLVTRGRAKLEVGDSAHAAHEGSVLYVAAGLSHRFVDIEQDLEVLVFFSKKKSE